MSESGKPDPRTEQPGICGVTEHTARFEWVCIKPVHAKVYRRRSRRRGQAIFNENPSSEQHHFVNRFPYREVTKE